MKSIHLALITATVACPFIVNMCDSDGKNESIVITTVNRRIYTDVYFNNSNNISTHFTCEDQETFMVEERTCMRNEDLFEGEYMHNRYLKMNTNSADYERPGLHIMYGPSELILYTPDEDHICQIGSLEVVRGVNKSFEIDHSGFILANGTQNSLQSLD